MILHMSADYSALLAEVGVDSSTSDYSIAKRSAIF